MRPTVRNRTVQNDRIEPGPFVTVKAPVVPVWWAVARDRTAARLAVPTAQRLPVRAGPSVEPGPGGDVRPLARAPLQGEGVVPVPAEDQGAGQSAPRTVSRPPRPAAGRHLADRRGRRGCRVWAGAVQAHPRVPDRPGWGRARQVTHGVVGGVPVRWAPPAKAPFYSRNVPALQSSRRADQGHRAAGGPGLCSRVASGALAHRGVQDNAESGANPGPVFRCRRWRLRMGFKPGTPERGKQARLTLTTEAAVKVLL